MTNSARARAPNPRPAHAALAVTGIKVGTALLWLCLWVQSTSAEALPPGASLNPQTPVGQFAMQAWDTVDGLPGSAIFAIVQDRRGYLWLATSGGLARFDGVRFETFNRVRVAGILNNAARAVLESLDGSIWAGFDRGGLHQFVDGHWNHLTTDQGLLDNSVLAIYQTRSGELWAGTRGGLQQIVGGLPTPCEPRPQCPTGETHHIMETADGDLLVLTDRALHRRRANDWTVVAAASGFGENQWAHAIVLADGDLMLAGLSGQLYRLSGENYANSEEAGSVEKLPSRLLQDRAGTRYAGSWGAGLKRFSGTGQGGETLGVADGLPDNRVITMMEDREGNLWLGTYSGLVRLKNSRFSVIDDRAGLPNLAVYSVYVDRAGQSWFGLDDGVARLSGGSLTHFPNATAERTQFQVTFQDQREQYWFGTDKGLFQLRDGQLEPLPASWGIPSFNVRSLLQIRGSEEIWIGQFFTGIARISGDGRFVDMPATGAPDRIVALFEDRAGHFLLGGDSGLYVLNDERFSRVRASSGPITAYIRTIYEDERGVLWLGTVGSGLLRMENSQVTAVTTIEGLYDDDVWHVVEDRNQVLWMCSDRGIFSAPRGQLDEFAAGTIDRIQSTGYGIADGIRDVECNGGVQPGAARRADGSILFPTMGGVVVVDTKPLPANRLPPEVVIEQVLVDGTGLENARQLLVDSHARQIEFQFTAPSLTDPLKVQFRYQLEGYDDWSPATNRRFVFYPRPPPGTYRFRVAASNNDGVWNEQGAAVELKFAAMYHETVWYRLALAALAALLIFAIHKLRVRSLKRQQAMLEQRVEERTRELSAANEELEAFAFSVTHDLRSPLQAISGFTELALATQSGQLDESVSGYLKEIDQGSSRMTHLIDDLLRFFRLSKLPLEVETVEPAVLAQEVINELRHAAPDAEVEFRLGAMPACQATASLLKQVFANLISNAVKFSRHSRPPVVEIGCNMENGQHTYFVRDNGVGFKPEEAEGMFELFRRLHDRRLFEGTGIGLALVRQIVERHGGRIWASGQPNRGATIYFTLGAELPR